MYLVVSFTAVIRVACSWIKCCVTTLIKAAKETMCMYLMDGTGTGVGDKKNEIEEWGKEGVLLYSMCYNCFCK